MKKIKFTLLTPKKQILNEKEVDSVTLPAWEGEMTVLYNHAPFMVQLKEGVLKYRDGNKEEFFAVYWGFAEIVKNNVIVLAEDAELSSEIDAQKVYQEYEKMKLAKRQIDRKENLEDLEIKLKKMIVELKLSKMIKKKNEK
ncbi:MAG: ATP synthase F1 subunit epsilon [Elusimicrobiales bacterium]|nr:ATP synthase F1 subunit epsilon [Elusimicrobiales bacterium]